jgi:phosphoglycerate-specific signal transduction histidine kinase
MRDKWMLWVGLLIAGLVAVFVWDRCRPTAAELLEESRPSYERAKRSIEERIQRNEEELRRRQ